MFIECSECKNKLTEDSYYEVINKKYGKVYRYKYCKKCTVDKHRIYNKKNYKKRSDQDKIQKRIYRYDLSTELYEQMIENQNNKCYICHMEFSNDRQSTKPFIDHNKDTKQIRKLICSSCNSAVGCGNINNIYIYDNIIKYLNKEIKTNYKYYCRWKEFHKQELMEMLNICNNSCEICKNKFNSHKYMSSMNIDHCHDESKKIRGILCHRCNLLLGHVKESIEICLKIKEYIIEHS